MRATFSIDAETDDALRRAAEALRLPKSEIVRRAVIDFEARRDRLSESERSRLMALLDEWLASSPTRPRRQAVAEVAEVRAARREVGKRRP